MSFLPYNPGVLPTKPAITVGDLIEFKVDGYPPYKDTHFSIRNIKHKDNYRFIKLREAGILAMNGRAWSHEPIKMDFILYAPAFEEGKNLNDYIGGIMDTLDGSSGGSFTYLPVIFEDDCQIATGHSSIVNSVDVKYSLCFEVLDNQRSSYTNAD